MEIEGERGIGFYAYPAVPPLRQLLIHRADVIRARVGGGSERASGESANVRSQRQ